MGITDQTAQALWLLLARLDESDGRRVATRLGLSYDDRDGNSANPIPHWWIPRLLHPRSTPVSVLHWMLEGGVQGAVELAARNERLPLGMRRDLADGIAPGTAGRVEGALVVGKPVPVADIVRAARGLTGPGRMRQARSVVAEIRAADWPEVIRADQEEPFPGFVRWALIARVDCPAELRERLGTHVRYRNRVRQAGVYPGGPAEYLAESRRPAPEVLKVLGIGPWGFPQRLAETDELLGAMAAELGGDEDAWAILAELLPDFAGTVAELVATAAAIAGVGAR